MNKDANKIGFVLQKAYFHAKGRFYPLEKFQIKDIKLVKEALGIRRTVNMKGYHYSTMNSHQKTILDMFGWKRFDSTSEALLELDAINWVEKDPSKEVILFKLIQKCWELKVTIPDYSKLCEIVSRACSGYEEQLQIKLSMILTDVQKGQLDKIFRDEILTSEFSSLSKIDQGINAKCLKSNSYILECFKTWLQAFNDTFEKGLVSKDALKYYSETVELSTLPQLKRLNKQRLRDVLAFSFITHQYFLRTDSSVKAFIKVMRSVFSKSRSFEREKHLEIRDQLKDDENLIINSTETVVKTIKLILSKAEDNTISLAQRNEQVIQLAKACLLGKDEENDLLDSLIKLRTELDSQEIRKHRYAYLFEKSNSLVRNFFPYLLIWEFDTEKSDKNILDAINYIRKNEPFSISKAPMKHLLENEIKIVSENDKIPYITKYKVFLLLKLFNGIDKKSIFMLYSYDYGSPEASFIKNLQWKKSKDIFLLRSGLENLKNCKGPLEKIGFEIYKLFEKANKKINDDENGFVYAHPSGGWRIDPHKTDFSTEKHIPSLLKRKNQSISLFDIIREIDHYSNFSDRFSNRRITKGIEKIDHIQLFTTLYSLGTNTGHHNTAKMSKDLTEKNCGMLKASFSQ